MLRVGSKIFEMKKYGSRTPSLRHVRLVFLKPFTSSFFLNKLRLGFHFRAGRNFRGIITSRHRGRVFRKRRLVVDFLFYYSRIPSIIQWLNNAFHFHSILALIYNAMGLFSYIIAGTEMERGLVLGSALRTDLFKIGSALLLDDVSMGSVVYNIQFNPFSSKGAVRSAGSFGVIVKKLNTNETVVLLPSGKKRIFSSFVRAWIGSVSNHRWKDVLFGKAGRSRWFGSRPRVRGIAMNPIDHPHGGGEGRTSGGSSSRSLWGWYTKGLKTRNVHKRPSEWKG